jgi:hydrogenase expression/formation protein HypD
MLKYLDEYRDTGLCLKISEEIKRMSSRPFNIMEVCGGHTMSIRKNGIHRMVGEHLRLISGPGCPVCVTAIKDVDRAVALSMLDNVTVCTFGDMFRVPGTEMSLEEARAAGGDVEVVYSVHDVLEFALREPAKDFIFVSIGFETTTPSAAAAVLRAREEKVGNFSVLALNKTMPAALRAVLEDESSKIDALICPGHVSAITGTGMYRFIVDELNVSCCIAGFEPVDILGAIRILVGLREKGETQLINAYERAVREDGNAKARGIVDRVFEPADAEWRGFGVIPASGLRVIDEYAAFDAEKRFATELPESVEEDGCVCGDILRGVRTPEECGLFGVTCTPASPKGACMVSSEGACAAWHRYGSG